MTNIPYVNLGLQAKEIMGELLAGVQRVLEGGHYVLGPEVSAFETAFASYCGSPHAVGVSNGTSALYLVLKAIGLKEGDEVITAPNSFIASATAISLAGGRPVFADIGEDLNIDPARLEAAITSRTRAILPVHLTGRPARMQDIMDIARRKDLFVLEDGAQAVGASLNGKRVGSWGDACGFSLHPLKNLHAFGDAGVTTCADSKLTETIKKARNLGFRTRDILEFPSTNDRLDELQAALLNVQLAHLARWTDERRRQAFRYNEALKSCVSVPTEGPGEYCVYQTYVIQADRRDELQKYLVDAGVEAKVHYPIPIHLQEAYRHLGYADADFPGTQRALKRILSLPLYQGLGDANQQQIIDLIRSFYAG